jgi:hypothetical protein
VKRALAERMHDLLKHEPGQWPSSCPICREQLAEAEREAEPVAELRHPEAVS